MAAISTVIAGVAAFASAAGAVKSFTSKPKAQANAGQAALNKQTEDTKRKRALQKKQRAPTDTLLTGGQGLGVGEGGTLG